MSREEVERLVMERINERAKQYIRDLPGSLVDDGYTIDPIDEELYETIYRDGLKDGIEWSIPTRYTPREEVTEGWWSAKHRREKGRHIVYVCSTPHSTDLTLRAWGPGCMIGSRLDEFTDFLPVPAWLAEGLKDG